MSSPLAPGRVEKAVTLVAAWGLGLLWVLPLIYAVWTAFHPPEFSTRFYLLAPLTLVLMTLYEMQAGNPVVTNAAGIALIAGRLLHIWGLGFGKLPGRAGGTILTVLTIIVLGVLLVIKGIATAKGFAAA